MVHKEIDIDAHSIHVLCVELFQIVDKTSLVDVFLEWVKLEMQGLVLARDWTPEI